MGTVLRARDPRLERDVAIKLLNTPRGSVPDLRDLAPDATLDLRTDSPSKSAGLLREARMMARLSHPNVLPGYEVGLDVDTVFVVMEHIDGTDRRVWSRDKSRKPRRLGWHQSHA